MGWENVTCLFLGERQKYFCQTLKIFMALGEMICSVR